MTTPHTPYALLEHVPLSECRIIWLSARHMHDSRLHLRSTLRVLWLRRALATVTAERDALAAELDAMRGEL